MCFIVFCSHAVDLHKTFFFKFSIAKCQALMMELMGVYKIRYFTFAIN
jgi:hypothetical protein